MILFGCNFTLYYLLRIGKIKDVLRSQEVKCYLLIIAIAITVVFLSLLGKFGAVYPQYSTEEAFRHSLFNVASLLTTTGFSTTDFGMWPTLAQTVLIIAMFFGAMAGSTAGGIKTSRIVIAAKGVYINIRKLINPRYVPKTKFEGKNLEEKTISDVFSFITMYVAILFSVTLLLSFDTANGQTFSITSDVRNYSVTHGFFTNFSAALACISNIGPGFEAVGPYSSFGAYNAFSKLLLSFTMIVGRLEILPMLILFSPRTWKKI